MSGTDRLAALLADAGPTLDRLTAVIAEVLSPDTDESSIVDRFDRVAHGVPSTDADGVMRHVFGTLGFHGNSTNYYAPENSLIDRVLERRTGNPLSLSVVAIETGRRIGVELSPIGMPAHFLIGDGHAPSRWFDPFAGGRALDREQCEQIFDTLTPDDASFDPVMLLPIPTEAVVGRVLANLRNAYVRSGDVASLISVLELRTALTACTVAEKVELARMLGAMGREHLAAEWYLRLAASEPEHAAKFREVAARHRARLN